MKGKMTFLPTLLQTASRRPNVQAAIKVALVVGTLLNHQCLGVVG